MIDLSEPKGGRFRTVCRVDVDYEPPKTKPQLLFKLPVNEHLYRDDSQSRYPKQGTNG
jgi:hypothetical protein